MQTSVVVKFNAPGFHHWPNPPEAYAYLGEDHRHVFYFEVEMYEHEGSRSIEIIELKDFLIGYLEANYRGEKCSLTTHLLFGPMSCEDIANTMNDDLVNIYGYDVKRITVLEDNENGATIANKFIEQEDLYNSPPF